MGLAMNNESELIRLTAVDFFTGETLIDKLVVPSVRIKHWNTRYSGVTGVQIAEAKARRTCLFGRDAARDELLRYVGPQTILIMHGGSSDMNSLRLLHPLIVDSFNIEGYHGGKVEGGRGLKNLGKLRTGRSIQNRGNRGHDSREDALATRELIINFMTTIPGHGGVYGP
jgi:RNA exonuclease 1